MSEARGIRDKVAVVGVGCCQFGENWDQSPSDMIVYAAYEAYADAHGYTIDARKAENVTSEEDFLALVTRVLD